MAVVITFRSDKGCGLIDTAQRGLDKKGTGREREAWNVIIPDIHGTTLPGLSVDRRSCNGNVQALHTLPHAEGVPPASYVVIKTSRAFSEKIANFVEGGALELPYFD